MSIVVPGEAYAPLHVDADAKLSLSIAMKSFKTVALERHQIVLRFGGVQNA